MRHMEFGELEDVYFFDLPQGEVTLAVGHEASPMGGNQLLLTRDGSNVHPSDLGVSGLDGLWVEGDSKAYGVPDEVADRLVEELEHLEGALT